MPAFLRTSQALLLAACLGGCTSLRPQVTAFATDYNRAIADSRNQVVLLNIVRSSMGEPTHYSALSQVEATLTQKGGVSAGSGGMMAGADDVFGTVTLEGSTAPTFTVVPLNTDEFATGILQPIGAASIRLLATQGWDSQLLATLLISKIECEVQAPGESYRRHVGNWIPESGGEFRSPFADVGIDFSEPDTEPPEAGTPGSYTLTVEGSRAAELLSSGIDEKFRLRQLPAEGTATRLVMARRPDEAITLRLPRGLIDCPSDAKAGDGHGPHIVANGDPVAARAYLRSIEGMIHFLGDAVRTGTVLTYTAGSADAPERRVLFALARDDDRPSAVAVTHHGQRYSISRWTTGSPDRSLQVIALVNQLLALQTSSDALKRTPSTVRVR
ncbi:MAG: hypothetical protein J7500_07850 [Sphingomonas sp.]|uniref:hypothetical protein n=1 Tax=Sphingomonas sp. TaxID=28214 RepID=UPI001B0CAAD8|nr:hypothetical protein [Sphingomonas sp.]MBO9622610.1 hypothetical protein [Sphingomonas sp.]